MVIRRSAGEKAFSVFNIVFMMFMVVITLYPFWYVVMCSFSDSARLVGARGVMLLPKGFSLASYQAVVQNRNILTGYRTTLIVVVCGTAINVFMTAICAFLLTRRKFALRGVMTYMTLFTMYFSGGMIPTYLVVFKWLHLGDTLWALLLPTAISTYNMIIMRTNFAAIPESLEESAKIDGANDILILFRIILPLSLPTVAVMVLFYGVAHWNSWFNALLYIRTRTKYPLQLVLREILIQNTTNAMSGSAGTTDSYHIGESIKYATIVVATVPILLVYPFIQKYFVTGVMIGAVKG